MRLWGTARFALPGGRAGGGTVVSWLFQGAGNGTSSWARARVHAFQGAGLAGWPAWMKAVVAASRQPGWVALSSVQCPVPGTGTSGAWGMVAVAPATLAGGLVLSAVP